MHLDFLSFLPLPTLSPYSAFFEALVLNFINK